MIRRLFALALLFVAATSSADSGMWGSRGISRRFLARDNIVYDVDGRGVTRFEISNPANIQRVGITLTDDETRDAAFAGDATLAVATSKGVELYATPSMTRTHVIEEPGGTNHIAATASFIAGATQDGVRIWTLSGDLVRTLRFPHPVNALAFVGDRLYIAVDEEALFVFDPEHGASLAALAINAFDLAMHGTTLYAAAGSNGVFAIDVASPSSPRVLGNSGAGDVNMTGIAIAGTRLFAMQSPDILYVFERSPLQLVLRANMEVRAIGSDGALLFLFGADGVPLRIIHPTSVETEGKFEDLTAPLSGVATDGTFAYLVDPPMLRVIDVSSPSQPREVASLEIPGIQDRIRIKRNLAVIYGRGDVNLVDISNPYQPRYLSVYHSLGAPRSNATIARDTIIEANERSGLHVVDYTSYPQPEQIAGRIWHYLDVVASDDAIYAFGVSKMIVLDISDRTRVVDRAEFVLPIEQAELAGDRVIVRGIDGFRIFSIEEPFAPRELAMVPISEPGEFGADEQTIYFAMNGTLQKIDLATPAIEETDLRVTSPMQISVANGKIVVADRYSLRIYGPVTAPPPPPPPAKRRAS